MVKFLVVAAFFTAFIVTSIPLFIAAVVVRVVTFPFDRRLRALQMLTCFWASLYTWGMPPWRVRVEGREKIRGGATYVVVSNHQSQLDVLTAFRLFFHFKWVSKESMFKVPLIGWNMWLNRYVPLRRGDKESIERMMRICRERLSEGSSVYFFPEGTRSPVGKLESFKLGAFKLAKEAGVPILPIVISGTGRALPKNTINYTGFHRILLRVLNEAPPDSFKDKTVEQLAVEIHDVMANELREMDLLTAPEKR